MWPLVFTYVSLVERLDQDRFGVRHDARDELVRELHESLRRSLIERDDVGLDTHKPPGCRLLGDSARFLKCCEPEAAGGELSTIRRNPGLERVAQIGHCLPYELGALLIETTDHLHFCCIEQKSEVLK